MIKRMQLFLPPASEARAKVIFSVCPHLREGGGVLHSQVRTGGIPLQARMGGYPPPGLDGVPPLSRTGWGTPSPIGRQSSIASTCYTAGGMPLAFTQEDFLVMSDLGLIARIVYM